MSSGAIIVTLSFQHGTFAPLPIAIASPLNQQIISHGSLPDYVQDDNLPIGRTMGQFILLPDVTFLILNGARKGTVGVAQRVLAVTRFRTLGSPCDL